MGHILSFVHVVHVATDQMRDAVLVLQHKQIKRSLVTALHALDQCLIDLSVTQG